jgi:uncharacterized protein (TIGR00288 family)
MPSNALCSIAVFHDGSYVARARGHFHHQCKAGWLQLGPLHALIEAEARERETTYERHCVTYAAWFQGVSNASKVRHDQLAKDRELQHDLMAVGVHPTFLPMTHAKEKGVDVALAISALEVAFTNRIDLIVLVTGDADFVPLVWALKRRGVRVGVLGFQYKHPSDETKCSFIATALRNAAHFCVDVAELERSAPQVFGGLFPARGRFESSRPPHGSVRASVADVGEEKDVES